MLSLVPKMRARFSKYLAFVALLCSSRVGFADVSAPRVLIDRVVVRWHAPETGGVATPQMVFERELAFEARIEALADPDPDMGAFADRHVRMALDRHIAETLLASMPIVPAPDAHEVAVRAELARKMLEQRCRGRDKLTEAAKAEGISPEEVDALLRRQARVSLYLDRMVAPMLVPSEAELRALLRTGTTPFTGKPFEEVSTALSQWVIGVRLSEAIRAYYQTARSRVVTTIIRAK